MARTFKILTIMAILFLSSCGQLNPTKQPVAIITTKAPTVSLTPTFTLTPTASLTPTAVPTHASTLTPTPSSSPTPTPIPRIPITVENIKDLFANVASNSKGGNDITWSPDGKWLALANSGGVSIFDATTHEKRNTIRLESGAPALMYNQEGTQLLVMKDKEKGLIWDVVNNQQIQEFDHLTQVKNFCAEGKSLYVHGWGSASPKIFCLNSKVQQILMATDGPSQAVNPDSTLTAVGMQDDATIIDVQSGKVLKHLEPKEYGNLQVSMLTFSPDNSLLALGGDAGWIHIWKVDTGELVKSIYPLGSININGLAFSVDNNLLAVTANSNSILLDLKNNDQQVDVNTKKTGVLPSGNISRMAFNLDGSLLATVYGDETVEKFQVWDTQTEKVVFQSEGHLFTWEELSAFVSGDVAWSPDGRLLAFGDNGSVRIFDSTTWKLQQSIDGLKVCSLAFSPDGKTLAVGIGVKVSGISVEDGIKLFDVNTARLIKSLEGNPQRRSVYPAETTNIVGSLIFSPGGNYLVSQGRGKGTNREGLKFWDIDSGEPSEPDFNPPSTNDTIYENFSIFNSNWKWMVSSGTGNTIIWQIKDGKVQRASPYFRINYFGFLAISPDGNILASAKWNHDNYKNPITSIDFWDINSKISIYNLTVKSIIPKITFSPDGCSLAIADLHNGVINIYTLK